MGKGLRMECYREGSNEPYMIMKDNYIRHDTGSQKGGLDARLHVQAPGPASQSPNACDLTHRHPPPPGTFPLPAYRSASITP